MGMVINNDAYKKMIDEDIQFLDNIMYNHDPDSLELKHIKEVLRDSVDNREATKILNRLLSNEAMNKVVDEFNKGLIAYLDYPWPFSKWRLKRVDILLDRLANLVKIFKSSRYE